MTVCKYVDQNGLAAILAAMMSAGFAPEVNLSIPLHAGKKACELGYPSLEVQNMSISGPTKMADVIQVFFK